jgi:hypothetical protein
VLIGQDSSYDGRNFHKIFNVQQHYLTCKKCLKFYKEVLNGEIEQRYRGSYVSVESKEDCI